MRFADMGVRVAILTKQRGRRKGAAAGLCLLTLAACNTDPGPTADTPLTRNRPETIAEASLPAPAVSLDLRGSLDEAVANPAASEPVAVPSLGPDETVARDSIANVLSIRPQFDIHMGYAPGDGATALTSALKEALNETAPEGIAGRYRIDGHVDISSTETGDTGVALTWAVMRGDGAPMGEVTQTTTTSPSNIASFWGDFAKSAAGPAAKGIAALITVPSRQEGNAS